MRNELRNFISRTLAEWQIQTQLRDRALDAVEFQYTWWADPENNTARGQEFINVSGNPNDVVLIYTTQQHACGGLWVNCCDSQFFTDVEVGIGVDSVVKQQSETSTTWMYQFNYNSWNNWLPDWMG